MLTQAVNDLLAAFKAKEKLESGAALMDADGFDIETARVLAAWLTVEPTFKPVGPMPDKGEPTARAWGWLIAGTQIDYPAIADAADVSIATARARIALLLGNRLIYPDGKAAKFAMDALRAALTVRVRRAARKASGQESRPAATQPKPATGAN